MPPYRHRSRHTPPRRERAHRFSGRSSKQALIIAGARPTRSGICAIAGPRRRGSQASAPARRRSRNTVTPAGRPDDIPSRYHAAQAVSRTDSACELDNSEPANRARSRSARRSRRRRPRARKQVSAALRWHRMYGIGTVSERDTRPVVPAWPTTVLIVDLAPRAGARYSSAPFTGHGAGAAAFSRTGRAGGLKIGMQRLSAGILPHRADPTAGVFTEACGAWTVRGLVALRARVGRFALRSAVGCRGAVGGSSQ